MLLCGTVFAQDTAQLAEQFKSKLADMQSDDANKIKNGQQDWQKICFEAGTPAQEKQKTEVVKLMAEALEKDGLKNTAKYWLIRQLGRLDDGENAELIGRFADDKERTVRDEAVWALANITNEKAGKTLEEMLAKETNADKKLALQNALKYRAERKAVDLPKLDDILKSLEAGNSKACQYVLPNLPWLTKSDVSTVPNFKDRFAKLVPEAKVLWADGMTARRDKSFVPFALAMTTDENESVRLAGFRALGPLGDASVLPILMTKIREGGDLGDTVRDSLARLNFDGADKMLLEAYDKSTDNGVKGNLLNVFNRRKGTIATPAFEAALKSSDEGIRRDAIRSLESIGQQASIPVLVDRYFVEEKKDMRDAIKKAIVQIESRYGDTEGRGKAFCDEIAKRNEKEQVQLIPIAGKIAGPDVGRFILDRYKNGKPAVQEAAFKALCNWTDASLAGELFQVASSNDDPRAAVAARAYIRIVTLNEHGRNDKDKLAYVEKAMSVAKSDDDKRFLLSRLDPSRCLEVFRFAVKHIDNPNLDQAACKAVVDMTNDTGFHMRHREEIEPWLDKVIEKSKDPNHVERAKRYKARR